MKMLPKPWRFAFALLLSFMTLAISVTANAEPGKADAQYLIIPGSGISECMLGSDESNFVQQFGGNRWEGYWIARDRGIEARVANGKVAVIFFHFYSNSYKPFNGKTREGIGRDSTIDSVIATYGKPDRIGESIVSPFGAMPGAHEKYLSYASIGIAFTFWDGRLADIRTFRTEQQ